MNQARAAFALGVVALALTGFFSPFWFLGFIPIGVGLVWAAYDLVEVTDGEPSSTPQR
jgi:hypothetical protein